jgi:hypothetical protein
MHGKEEKGIHKAEKGSKDHPKNILNDNIKMGL